MAGIGQVLALSPSTRLYDAVCSLRCCATSALNEVKLQQSLPSPIRRHCLCWTNWTLANNAFSRVEVSTVWCGCILSWFSPA